jgi:hypothetical protein
MTDTPQFDRHDAYSSEDSEYVLETTRFDSRVTTVKTDSGSDSGTIRYTLTVRAPTLDSAVEEDVGPNLLDGWLETFERRLKDAPTAVRGTVELDDHSVYSDDGEAVVTLSFLFGSENASRAPDAAKAMAEYVEGTYVEGIVPGYTYQPPVSEMLDHARQGDNEDKGGPMPL